MPSDPENLARKAGEVKTRSVEGEGDRVGTQPAPYRPDHPHPRRSWPVSSATRPTSSTLRAGEVTKARVLAIAGSDSGGGAGIQADIKAITALGAYAATAITALTAQNTLGVHGIRIVPPEFIFQQISVVLDDIGADAIKTGMLGNVPTIETVADALARYAPDVPLVLDPVMVAKGGAQLLDPGSVHALVRHLLPKAQVITPNLPEAEVLTGRAIPDVAAMHDAARALLDLGVPAVLLKGGHLPGDELVDLLATPAGIEAFAAPRIASRNTHGTGCTMASAIAAGLAQGMSLRDAVVRARAYVRAAIATAPGLGAGHGPLNHSACFADGCEA